MSPLGLRCKRFNAVLRLVHTYTTDTNNFYHLNFGRVHIQESQGPKQGRVARRNNPQVAAIS